MKIKKLIEFTNSSEYYQEAQLELTQIIAKRNRYNDVTFNFVLEGIGKPQKWQLIAHRCECFSKMYRDRFIPYIQLKMYTNHPLLWSHKSNILHCELIGFPKDVDTFLGQIYQAYIKRSNNWLQATEHFFATEHAFKKNKKKSLHIPENLRQEIEGICKGHSISFEVKEEQIQENCNLKVLVFDNEYISPDGFNMGQPYIIADEFFIEKVY